MQEPVWGKGDKLTLNVLSTIAMNGKWLDLAAGDGRYVPELLDKADRLVVSDVDIKVLRKLLARIPEDKRSKIKSKPFDLTGKFPFKDSSFDGVFCTGTLHLFSENTLNSIFKEISIKSTKAMLRVLLKSYRVKSYQSTYGWLAKGKFVLLVAQKSL